jgi:hypothetical protein
MFWFFEMATDKYLIPSSLIPLPYFSMKILPLKLKYFIDLFSLNPYEKF